MRGQSECLPQSLVGRKISKKHVQMGPFGRIRLVIYTYLVLLNSIEVKMRVLQWEIYVMMFLTHQ